MTPRYAAARWRADRETDTGAAFGGPLDTVMADTFGNDCARWTESENDAMVNDTGSRIGSGTVAVQCRRSLRRALLAVTALAVLLLFLMFLS
jgi:hypothetical protein